MFLECSNITFRYPETDEFVFKDLTLSVSEPGFHAIFGPSGVGKTSFAKIVMSEIDGFTGEIRTEKINRFLYTYNLERLPGWSSVKRHIDKVTPPSKDEIKGELINAFGIREHMGARFSNLSLGQQNRVNLLRYLLQDFDLLIMDESLANVDELTKEDIILKVKKMFPEVCFFYISHNIIEVSKFCKQIFVLRDAYKQPQVGMVRGLDFSDGQSVQQKDLEPVMLEIMSAS